MAKAKKAKASKLGNKPEQAKRKTQKRSGIFQRGINIKKITSSVRSAAKAIATRIKSAASQLVGRTSRESRTSRAGVERAQKKNLGASTEGKKLSSKYDQNSNLLAQIEINTASVGLPSTWTKEEIQIFYAATQKAWDREGISVNNRNRAILEYFGRTNLYEFVNEVLARNKLAVQVAKGEIKPEELTSKEAEEFYAAAEADNEEADYALMMSNVIRFNASDFNTPERRR